MDMQWKDAYSVGVEEIDDQHKQFLKILRRFHESMGKATTYEMLTRSLLEIRRYAEYHFVSEENLMLHTKYPTRDAHTRVHQSLLDDLKHHIRSIDSQQENTSDLVQFMVGWFTHHTQNEDKAFGKWLIERSHQAVLENLP